MRQKNFIRTLVLTIVFLFPSNTFSQSLTAEQIYKKVTDSEEYVKKGSAKHGLGDYRGAIQDYNKAIEISPNLTKAYILRGTSKYYLKDFRGSIEDHTKAIAINPNFAEAYYSRGFANFEFGDKNEACSDWRKASKLGYSKAYDLIKEYCK